MKIKRMLLIFMALCTLTACQQTAPNTEVTGELGDIPIYYISSEQKSKGRIVVTSEMHNFSEYRGNDKYIRIIESLMQPDYNVNLSVLGKEVTMQSIMHHNRVFVVDFDYHYAELTDIEKIVASAVIARTLFETGDVDYVKITAEGIGQLPMMNKYIAGENVIFNEDIMLP